MRQLFLSFIFLLNIIAVSQAQTLKFQAINGASGVSLGKINAITHDKYGYLWLSDQLNRCLIRYDGNKMTRFQKNALDSNSLGGYYPECLFADSSGNIWIGFYGFGLDKFNPSTNKFTHYRHKKNDPNSLSSDTLSAVLMDQDGKIWIGTPQGLDVLDQTTGTFTHYKHDPANPNSLSWNTVRSIVLDRKGDLWIGTGLIWTDNGRGGLNRFNRDKNNFTRFLHDPQDPTSLADNNVRCIYEDSYGNFWVGTGGVGIQSLDRKTGKFTHYPYDPRDPGKLSRSKPRSRFDNITFIVEDAKRNIWFGTYAGGITRYNPATGKVERYEKQLIGKGNIIDTTAWAGHAMADGTVWIGTELNNFFKTDVNITKLPYYAEPYSFGRMLKEGQTEYITSTQGFIRRNRTTGMFDIYSTSKTSKGNINLDGTFDLLRDRKGVMWVGGTNGLHRFNEKTQSLELFDLRNNEPAHPNINAMMEDSEGRLWVGSFSGLYMIGPNRDTVSNFRNNSSNDNSPSGNSFIEMVEVKPGVVMAALASNGGLNKFDLNTNTWTRYNIGIGCYEMKKDKDGVIWTATDNGLLRYDSIENQFVEISQDRKVKGTGGIINLVVDNSNNIWISTFKTLYKINAARNQLTEYGEYYQADESSGFQYGCISMAGDQIFLGCNNGYYLFNPDSIKFTGLSEKLLFSGFWLGDTKLIPADNSPLKEPIQVAREIELNYNSNTFSFSASLINLKNYTNEFQYRLEPFDGQWRTGESEERIQYYNLPSGKYLLTIRANTINGEWITRQMDIVIRPPWWKSLWAYALYAILAIIAALSIHRYQRSRIIEKERMRNSQRELEQAREIQKAYNQLKATQAQLVQSEKMASLGELTAGIAHEIQNPLNFVNNFAEVNTELNAEGLDALQRGDLGDTEEILKRMLDNEQKILQHGKRADAIVKSMLQHSRASVGNKEPTDINALADEYLRLAYHGLRAKDKSFNSEFRLNADPSVGKINVVPQDIGRVLLNLVNNAFYAVKDRSGSGDPDYKPLVEVSTRRDHDKVIITVKDNGKGVPEQIRQKIFQPFYTTKPTGEGTGLGLSLSYDIIKAHGGEIRLETKEGEGSAFMISLPVSSK